MYSCPRRESGRSVHHSLVVYLSLNSRSKDLAEHSTDVLRGLLTSIPTFWAGNEIAQVVTLYITRRKADTSLASIVKAITKRASEKVVLTTLTSMWTSLVASGASAVSLSLPPNTLSCRSCRNPGNIRPILRRPPPFAAYIQQSSRPTKPTPYIQHAPRSPRRPQAPNPSPFFTLSLSILLMFRNVESGYNLRIHGTDCQPQREHVPSAFPAVLRLGLCWW